MAKRGRFLGGAGYGGVPMQIINQIRQQSAGINTSSTTDTVKPSTDTVNPSQVENKTKDRSEKKIRRAAYTADEIANSEYLSALKTGLSSLTYEQALANYRALTKVNNMMPLAKAQESPAYKKKATQMVRRSAAAMAKLTPEQKYAEEIFFAMGGSLEANDPKYGGYGMGSVNTDLYKILGLTPPSTSFAPVKFDVNKTGKSVEFKLNNPLNDNQREALQRLRALNKSGVKLTAKQSSRLAKLKAIKNAPTIITE